MKYKFKASFLHFIASIFVVGGFLLFALNVWYPAPFFSISGLLSIIIILITVDVILGPLLTFVIFKPGKKTLKFDMTVVILLQAAALSYGMYTIYQAHPLYIVYAGDRFTTIHANEINPDVVKIESLKKSRLAGPSLVYAEKPTKLAELSRISMEALSGLPDLDARPEFYRPFLPHLEQVFKKSISVKSLMTKPENKLKLEKFLRTTGITAENYLFVPLIGRNKDIIWVLHNKTGKPAGSIDINPWQLG